MTILLEHTNEMDWKFNGASPTAVLQTTNTHLKLNLIHTIVSLNIYTSRIGMWVYVCVCALCVRVRSRYPSISHQIMYMMVWNLINYSHIIRSIVIFHFFSFVVNKVFFIISIFMFFLCDDAVCRCRPKSNGYFSNFIWKRRIHYDFRTTFDRHTIYICFYELRTKEMRAASWWKIKYKIQIFTFG